MKSLISDFIGKGKDVQPSLKRAQRTKNLTKTTEGASNDDGFDFDVDMDDGSGLCDLYRLYAD